MQLKATVKEAEAEAACPSLSATELATVAKPSLDMTDIGSFVVFAIYLISAAALVPTIRTRSGNVPGSLRCPSLLYAGIVVGLLLAAASATPPLFRSYDVVFHTMVWFQVVGLPMAILLQCVRMHNEMAHVQLYAQRLVVTQALRASQGVKAGGTNSDEAARHLARCIAATTPQRMAVLALPVIFVLMAAAAIAHAMLNPCSELVLGPFGLAGALAPSLLGFIAQATLSAMLLRLLTVDAYHRRIELVCHCALNGAALMALPVTAFVLNAAHPTVVLLVSFRLGTALLATAGLVTSLVLAYLVRRTGSEGAAADKAGFDTLFSPASAELKAKFNEFLNTQLAGHLLLFYDEVELYKRQYDSAVDREKDPAVLSAGLGFSKEDVVRKAKMGMAARLLYSQYIEAAAPLQLDMDDLMLTELTSRVLANNLSCSMYDGVRDRVYEQMRCYYPLFSATTKLTEYSSI